MLAIFWGLALSACSCQKEQGYTGFIDNSGTASGNLDLTTDKACYSPGETIRFTASEDLEGAVYVRYMHLGDIVEEDVVTSSEWTWTAPSSDHKGYMAEVYSKSSSGETILGTIAVDVSSDWSRFPRYGFLSSYGEMSETAIASVIDNLNRLHINGVQFQDWHWKHHWPLGGTPESPLETYLDIASRTTSLSTLKGYISKIHDCGMKAIFYNLCYGALSDAAEDGVNERWYIFSDQNHSNKDMHSLSAPFKSSIWLVNPANEEWLDYIGGKTDDVYEVLDFDGYQIDQLGNRGTRYDYDGNEIDMPAAYAKFIKEMKTRQPEKDLIMNAVSGFGAESIAGSGDVAFCYDEMWNTEDAYTDLRDHIETNQRYGGSSMNTVFAAYMNYDKADNLGTFNTPGVLLTDAVIFSLGGAHIELGEHMLGKEYFPNSNLGMSEDLQEAMIAYYDFMTAYQNLLRDGGSFNEVSVASADGKIQVKDWAPAAGSVITLGRSVEDRQVIHLLNFSQANSTSWRDLDGSMPEPNLVENISLNIAVDGEVSSIWMASPDLDGGACKEISFTQNGNTVSLTLPSIKYWDMVVIEY